MPIEMPQGKTLLRRIFNRGCILLGKEIKEAFVPLCDKYPKFRIGKWTYGDPIIFSYNDGTRLVIGSFCSIASRVTILLGGEHRSDWATTCPFNALWPNSPKVEGNPKSKGDVNIGHDVWIGIGSTIVSGVTIGTGAVIGAHSLVTRNVPAYAIAAGNPAKIIRYRFDDFIIKRLLDSRWWEMKDVDLEKYLPLLMSDKIEDFLTAVEGRSTVL